MKLSSIIGKLAGFVGARFFGAGIGFLSQIALTRLLPVADVGIVFLGMSIAAFISLAVVGGYALLAMTHVPRLVMHGKNSGLHQFNNVVMRDSALATGMTIVIVFALVKSGVFTEGQNIALVFGCLCAPASGILRFNSALATADRRVELGYVPDFLVRPVLFLLVILFGYLIGFTWNTHTVLLTFAAMAYVTALGQAFILAPAGLAPLSYSAPRQAFSSRLRPRAFALTIVSAVAFAFADIVTMVAGLILPADEVALVGVTIRLAAIAGFILQAGQMFVMTDFTQAVMRRDETLVRALLLKINLTTLAVVGIAVIGALIFGHFALGIFGSEYVRGTGLLALFMVGQSIRALGGMNQHILSINGQQMRTAGACVVTLLIFFCLAWLLTQQLGFLGIGYAVIGAEVTWLLALAGLSQKLCGRRGDMLWLIRNP